MDIIIATTEIAVFIQNFLSSKMDGLLRLGLICKYVIPLGLRLTFTAYPYSYHIISNHAFLLKKQ